VSGKKLSVDTGGAAFAPCAGGRVDFWIVARN